MHKSPCLLPRIFRPVLPTVAVLLLQLCFLLCDVSEPFCRAVKPKIIFRPTIFNTAIAVILLWVITRCRRMKAYVPFRYMGAHKIVWQHAQIYNGMKVAFFGRMCREFGCTKSMLSLTFHCLSRKNRLEAPIVPIFRTCISVDPV
jgi:hypothetical protein